MRKYHNTLLTTAAAVALVVSAGLAAAQDSSKPESPGAATHAMPNNSMGQRQTGQRPASSAQQQPSNTPATAQEQQRPNAMGGKQKPSSTAQEQQQPNAMGGKQKPSSTAQEQQRRSGTSAQQRPSGTAQQQPGRGGPDTAQRQRGLNGLQGNASGTNVQLSGQQRTDIRRTVIDARGAPKVGHVDFDVTVGTAVPRGRIHAVPVPESLVRIEPRWRGYLYFVYADDIVVVNPRDMRIVAVLAV
ncbi:MAG TPA: DUF1236 domain-containing protein [Xanthobacteraceae bacterium]|nr:DUF1236 domain-containing protein [Xanthobacteraceae bacterium]